MAAWRDRLRWREDDDRRFAFMRSRVEEAAAADSKSRTCRTGAASSTRDQSNHDDDQAEGMHGTD